MEVTGKARVGIGKWTITGVAMIAAVFSLAGNAPAQAQAAPIVYKSAAPASRILRLENNAASMTLSVAPHSRIPTFETSPIAAEPVVNANFGPLLATPTTRSEPSRGLQSAPAFAEPYAGPPYVPRGRR